MLLHHVIYNLIRGLIFKHMEISEKVYQNTILSEAPAFDGLIFIGVKTTGIFCRPVCPAKTPKFSNVEFYKSTGAAIDAGFRPCLRCRPECTPGTAAWMGTSAVILRALKLINQNIEENYDLEILGNKLGISGRHLRRLFKKHLGTTPSSVINTVKLLFAKKLITETGLSMADIAFASGYKSIRNFNYQLKKVYNKPPSALRKGKISISKPNILHLSFHPPFNFRQITGFLKIRAIPGVEFVSDDIYSRSIEIDNMTGFITVSCKNKENTVNLEVEFPDIKKLFYITETVKSIFDLNTPVKKIDELLKKDKFLSNLVKQNPGIRVPGSFNSFELCIRAIVGQQVSVKGATTIIGRIASKYGKKLNIPNNFGLKNVFPGPEILAISDFEGIGLTKTRISTIKLLSKAVLEDRIIFNPFSDPADLKNALLQIKGIGEWTARYIIMRTVKSPDAFPYSDLGLLKAVSSDGTPVPEKLLKSMAVHWKPWRAYAAMYLWSNL